MDEATRKRVEKRALDLFRENPHSDAEKNWKQAMKEQEEAFMIEALAASKRESQKRHFSISSIERFITKEEHHSTTVDDNVITLANDVKRLRTNDKSTDKTDKFTNINDDDDEDEDDDNMDTASIYSACSSESSESSCNSAFSASCTSDCDHNETISAQDGRYIEYKNWDMWKIKRCLVHHDFETLTKVGGVIPVNGITNAGKSVTITCQHPSVSRVPSGVPKEYVCISSTPNVRAPRSRLRTDKQSWMSMSGNLTLYNQGGVWYADMPGLQDTRGKEEVFWTHACLNLFYSTVQSIPAVLVVINFASHFYHDRGSTEQFNKLSVKLYECFGGQEDMAQSVVFVLTRPFDQGDIINYEDIKERAREYIEGQTEAIQIKKQILYKRHFQRRKKTQKHQKSSYDSMSFDDLGDDSRSNVDIGPSKVSNQDRQDWAYIKEREAGIFVMKMIQAALKDYRVCISDPIDRTTTEVQRLQINEMILRARPVSSSTLEAIRTNAVENSLEFCKILAELARDYNQILRKLVKDLEALTVSAEFYSTSNDQVLKHIRDNWEKVRDDKLGSTTALIAQMEESCACLEKDMKKFGNSRREVVADSKLISRSKESGWLSWTIFGGGWAEEKYEYTEGIPFVKFKLSGGTSDHISIINRSENKYTGKLKCKLVSDKGYDLRTTVQVYALEKDLLSSKERVKKNEEATFQLMDELDRARNFEKSLESCKSAQELTKLLCEDFDALESAVQHQTNELKKKVSSLVGSQPDQIVQEEHVRMKLHKLLSLLTDRGLLHPSLSQADLADIDEFCEYNDKYHALLTNPLLQKYSPNHQVIVEATSSPDESRARVALTKPSSDTEAYKPTLNKARSYLFNFTSASQVSTPTTPVQNALSGQTQSIAPTVYNTATNNQGFSHGNRVTFKVHSLDTNDARRFTIENDFHVFQHRLQNSLPLPWSQYRLSWKDFEGDHIAVESNDDFKEAIATQNQMQASVTSRRGRMTYVFYTKQQHPTTPLISDKKWEQSEIDNKPAGSDRLQQHEHTPPPPPYGSEFSENDAN